MKQFRIVLLVLAVLLFGALTLVQAQEDDNACYAGGVLDSKCQSDWEWICGYYLQQWQAAGGWNGTYAFPDWCDPASVLPRKPETPAGASAPAPVSLAGCYTDNSTVSLYYNGVSGSEFVLYLTFDCTGEVYVDYPYYATEAADEAAARAACDAIVGPSAYLLRPSDHSVNSPSSLWACVDFS